MPSGTLPLVKRCRLLLILCLITLPLYTLAADDLVRVEVLVFQYNNGQPDAWPVVRLEDFSALPDPRQRALLAAWTARYRDPDEIDEGADAGLDDWPGLETDAQFGFDAPSASDTEAVARVVAMEQDHRGPVWPELFVHDTQLSATMRRARDRLDNSPAHEILSVTTWLQPLERRSPAPAVRVRDDSPISLAWLSPDPIPYRIDPELNAPERLPSGIFRLDGSVRIRQRQFRHAELNLVWSERFGAPPGIAAADADQFVIHRLQQSRPIQLGRLEYFDSPWIGALILVEPWQPSESSAAGGR